MQWLDQDLEARKYWVSNQTPASLSQSPVAAEVGHPGEVVFQLALIGVHFGTNQLGKLTYRKFRRVADVDRAGVISIHQKDHSIN